MPLPATRAGLSTQFHSSPTYQGWFLSLWEKSGEGMSCRTRSPYSLRPTAPHVRKLRELEKERAEAEARMNRYLAELGYGS